MNTKWLFRITLLLIIFLELLSFFANFFPNFNSAAFFIILTVVLVLTLIKLEYGVYLVAAELVIGSHGYLFAFDPEGVNFSLRMGLFLIVMSVWLLQIFQNKRLEFLQSRLKWWYLALAGSALLAIFTSFINRHDLVSILFDFNSWLYFFLILPIYQIFQKKSGKEVNQVVRQLGVIVLAALAASIFKSFVLLYIFSHNPADIIFDVYKWVRDSRVGEITLVNQNFYRVFLPSQIYSLLFGFTFLFYLFSYLLPSRREKIRKEHWLVLMFTVLTISSVLISFSRSFWVAGIIGVWLLGFYLIFVQRHYFEGLVKFVLVPFSSGILCLGLIILVVRFPYPPIKVDYSAYQLLKERFKITDEAAVSSRYALLKPLWQEIINAPPPGLGVLIGKGFGATISFKTFDPTVLRSNPLGIKTTYAFEWGWLDIWLKTGLVGVLIYLALIGNLFWLAFKNSLKAWRGEFREKGIISVSIAISLIVLAITNAFTPYLNHPLGIGFLLFSSVVLEKWLMEGKGIALRT